MQDHQNHPCTCQKCEYIHSWDFIQLIDSRTSVLYHFVAVPQTLMWALVYCKIHTTDLFLGDCWSCNFSKTKFLLIGPKQQLAKLLNSFIETTHSARNLGFIFDENLSFSDQISAPSTQNPAISTFVNFAASIPILISKQPVHLPPTSFTTNLIIVTHCTTAYQATTLTVKPTSTNPKLYGSYCCRISKVFPHCPCS